MSLFPLEELSEIIDVNQSQFAKTTLKYISEELFPKIEKKLISKLREDRPLPYEELLQIQAQFQLLGKIEHIVKGQTIPKQKSKEDSK